MQSFLLTWFLDLFIHFHQIDPTTRADLISKSSAVSTHEGLCVWNELCDGETLTDLSFASYINFGTTEKSNTGRCHLARFEDTIRCVKFKRIKLCQWPYLIICGRREGGRKGDYLRAENPPDAGSHFEQFCNCTSLHGWKYLTMGGGIDSSARFAYTKDFFLPSVSFGQFSIQWMKMPNFLKCSTTNYLYLSLTVRKQSWFLLTSPLKSLWMVIVLASMAVAAFFLTYCSNDFLSSTVQTTQDTSR